MGELDLSLTLDEEAFGLVEMSYDRSSESCFEILTVLGVDPVEVAAVASLAPTLLVKIHVSVRMRVY